MSERIKRYGQPELLSAAPRITAGRDVEIFVSGPRRDGSITAYGRVGKQEIEGSAKSVTDAISVIGVVADVRSLRTGVFAPGGSIRLAPRSRRTSEYVD